MKKFRTGDAVVVIAGKWKGAKSTLEAFVGEDKVIVKGVNTIKKSVKGEGFVEQDAPIHISNIALYDATTEKASRVRITTTKTGKKQRVYVTSGKAID